MIQKSNLHPHSHVRIKCSVTEPKEIAETASNNSGSFLQMCQPAQVRWRVGWKQGWRRFSFEDRWPVDGGTSRRPEVLVPGTSGGGV
jgi:hypothetical protein